MVSTNGNPQSDRPYDGSSRRVADKSIRELIAAKGFRDESRPAGSHHGRLIVHEGTGLRVGVWSAQTAIETIIHGTEAVQ